MNRIKASIRNEKGQGITEYAAILAFVSLLVMLVFGFSQGQLANALQMSFSSVAGQIDRLAATANST